MRRHIEIMPKGVILKIYHQRLKKKHDRLLKTNERKKDVAILGFHTCELLHWHFKYGLKFNLWVISGLSLALIWIRTETAHGSLVDDYQKGC